MSDERTPATTGRPVQHVHVYPTPPDLEASNPPWRWVVTAPDGSWRADGWTLTRLGARWAAWRAERRRPQGRWPASRPTAMPSSADESTAETDDGGAGAHAA